MNGEQCNKTITNNTAQSGYDGRNNCDNHNIGCTTSNCIEPLECINDKCVCPDNVNSCQGQCITAPCNNGGTCHPQGTNDYICQCFNGFNGLCFVLT